MANKFLGVLCVLAIASRAMAGVTHFAHTPYAAYHVPASAATVYQTQPLAYHTTSPYFARSLVAAGPAAAVQSYTSPFVRTYAAAPLTAVSPVLRTYAAETAAPVYAKSAVVAAPAAAVLKTAAPAPLVATAPVVTKAAVVATAPVVLKNTEFDSEPRYDFSYGVHDSVTGDIKNQVESRNGGNVAGSYSVVDADGYKRTVTYTADDLNGFNAVVQREPIVRFAADVSAPAALATPVQQHFEFLPTQQVIHQGYLPQGPNVPLQPEQASEPVPTEYPDQQQTVQQQYPQHGQQYPSFPQFENPQQQGSNNGNNDGSDDDSEVVEARSAADDAASTPISENQQDSIAPKRTA